MVMLDLKDIFVLRLHRYAVLYRHKALLNPTLAVHERIARRLLGGIHSRQSSRLQNNNNNTDQYNVILLNTNEIK